MLCAFRPVRSGVPDSPQQPDAQPVCGSHLLPHGISEVCSQTTYAGAAGTVFVYRTPSCSFTVAHPGLKCTSVFSGLLLPVAVRGTAWGVSGEHVQPGQSAAPDGPHALSHTLLPEGTYPACTETGGTYAYKTFRSAIHFLLHASKLQCLSVSLLHHSDFKFRSTFI